MIRVVAWKPEEAAGKAALLEPLGAVELGPITPESLRALKASPPSVVVIDLDRLPSHGRDVAMALRETKATRAIPIVFAGGDPAKVERVRQQVPGATFVSWRGVVGAVKRALAGPRAPAPPATSRLAGYSGPLPKKLGIRPGGRVLLRNAPKDFAVTLGELPERAMLTTSRRGPFDVIVAFCASSKDLRRVLDDAGSVDRELLWICWPKKASGVATDLTEGVVRDRALEAGLVDSKVAAIDATWAGLRFTQRRTRPG